MYVNMRVCVCVCVCVCVQTAVLKFVEGLSPEAKQAPSFKSIADCLTKLGLSSADGERKKPKSKP